jgi:methionine biosynthesis protein MetW
MRMAPRRGTIRIDLQLIADMVEARTRVLDIGCGDGALLEYLVHFKQVDGRGMELSQEGVNACVGNGLSVIQGDADTDLRAYPTGAFDYVILSQTLQATRDPRGVLQQMLRVGRRAVVSFPNFGFWRVRLGLLVRGRMPTTETLPYSWYDTPNIHLCTIADFLDLCAGLGVEIERMIALGPDGRKVGNGGDLPAFLNWRAEQAVFLLGKKG